MSISPRSRRRAPYDPNNKRLTELSRIARHLYTDETRDYVLPETSKGRALAIAIITHLYRAGRRNGHWLFDFCKARAPWLDPNEIDLTNLKPEKADSLGVKIGLTDELRTRLGVTTIRPCDKNFYEYQTLTQKRRRQRDRDRKRRRREAEGCMRRADYEAESLSRSQPWLKEGICRRAWERRRKLGKANQPSLIDDKGAARLAQSVDASPSPISTVVASGHTCDTENHRLFKIIKGLRPDRNGAYDLRDLLYDFGVDFGGYFKPLTFMTYYDCLQSEPEVNQHFENGTLVIVDRRGIPCKKADLFKLTDAGLRAMSACDSEQSASYEYQKAA
jgi:hypothetical protein